MWYQFLAAACLEGGRVKIYVWQISHIEQLFQQVEFVHDYAGKRKRLLWLELHCKLTFNFGFSWIVE